MYQRDPDSEAYRTKFLLDRINDLEATVDRLVRYQNGMYVTTSEHNCVAAMATDIEGVDAYGFNGITTSGLASVIEFRGNKGVTGGYVERWWATGQKITVRNILERKLFKGERWTFSKDKNGVWYPCVPLGTGISAIVGEPSNALEQAMIGKTGDGGISGMQEDTPGAGYVAPHVYDHNTRKLEPLRTAGSPKWARVMNMASSPVSGGKFIQCKLINGAWFVDVEPC